MAHRSKNRCLQETQPIEENGNQGSLTFSSQGEGVPSSPVLSSRRPNYSGVSNSLSKSPMLSSCRSKSSLFSVFVNCFADPVDLWVSSNRSMEGVDADDLVVLKSTILTNPVTAENSQRLGYSSSKSWLSDGLMIPCRFELIDSLSLGFSKDCSFGCLPFSASSSNPDSVDDESLLRFVS